jgi:hypothetical protein
MLINSKIALSLALVLATASAAMAAPKQPVRPNTAAFQQQVSAGSPEPRLGELPWFGALRRFSR